MPIKCIGIQIHFAHLLFTCSGLLDGTRFHGRTNPLLGRGVPPPDDFDPPATREHHKGWHPMHSHLLQKRCASHDIPCRCLPSQLSLCSAVPETLQHSCCSESAWLRCYLCICSYHWLLAMLRELASRHGFAQWQLSTEISKYNLSMTTSCQSKSDPAMYIGSDWPWHGLDLAVGAHAGTS